jgi:uncharacterized protein (DUF58 family)
VSRIPPALRAAATRVRRATVRARHATAPAAALAADLARPVARRVAPVVRTVSGLGWAVLAGSLACWLAGALLGWVEPVLAATVGLLLAALCALLTIGRTRLRVSVEVDPTRVTVGGAAAGRVTVTNSAARRLLPVAFELPIGAGAARFSLPSLAGGASHEELFVVPTHRRGVIPIGPATSVRGDPFGLFRRTMGWTDVQELFVHPLSVPLAPLGSGILRDLEGQTTNDVSMSDLAFHTLREYAPGDDRRYIHWRSSAKLAALRPGTFLVRQFLDTRRSHVTVVVDADPGAYADPEEFETAISAAASVVRQSVRDEQDTSLAVGTQAVPAGTGRQLLDALSRAELGQGGLADVAPRAAGMAPDTSLLLLVTGRHPGFGALHRAAAHFPPEARRLALRIDPAAPVGVQSAGPLTVLSLQRLADLPPLLAAGTGQ